MSKGQLRQQSASIIRVVTKQVYTSHLQIVISPYTSYQSPLMLKTAFSLSNCVILDPSIFNINKTKELQTKKKKVPRTRTAENVVLSISVRHLQDQRHSQLILVSDGRRAKIEPRMLPSRQIHRLLYLVEASFCDASCSGCVSPHGSEPGQHLSLLGACGKLGLRICRP